MAEGFFTSRNPRSLMAKTPSSFTGPKRFLMERIRRNALHGPHSVVSSGAA